MTYHRNSNGYPLIFDHANVRLQCTSGLQSAIFNSVSGPTSDKVGGITVDSGLVENVGLAVGISVIYHSVQEIQCTSGFTVRHFEFRKSAEVGQLP